MCVMKSIEFQQPMMVCILQSCRMTRDQSDRLAVELVLLLPSFFQLLVLKRTRYSEGYGILQRSTGLENICSLRHRQ